MRQTIRHGGVVKCDVPGCKEQFTTYSVVAKAREQAANVGWTRPKLRTMPGWEEFGLGEGRGKVIDCCPSCKPKPRMTGKDVAA